jgi:hypothetical protein
MMCKNTACKYGEDAAFINYNTAEGLGTKNFIINFLNCCFQENLSMLFLRLLHAF